MPKKDKKNELVKRIYRPVTIDLFINFMVTNGILTAREAWICRRTGILPQNILERLRMAELKNKN